MPTFTYYSDVYERSSGSDQFGNSAGITNRIAELFLVVMRKTGIVGIFGGLSMKPSVQTFLIAYSAVLSTLFAVVLLMGAKDHRGRAFDEIQVHRINVVEPDGTLRMVISDRDQMP